jgi:hypothetical protein
VIPRQATAPVLCLVTALTLTGCAPHSWFTARNTIPGVVVTTQATVDDSDGVALDPAGRQEAKVTAKTAIRDCGAICSGKPSRIVLARFGALGSDAGKLVWVIEYPEGEGSCNVVQGPHHEPSGPGPVTPAPTPRSVTCYEFVDAIGGGLIATMGSNSS